MRAPTNEPAECTTTSTAFSRQSPASNMYLGNSYVYAREFQPGVDAYKEALRLKANDVRGHIQLGVAYDYMNRNQEAVEEFKSALKLDAANSKAHYRLIISYLKLGNKPAAITEYQILQALQRIETKVLLDQFCNTLP